MAAGDVTAEADAILIPTCGASQSSSLSPSAPLTLTNRRTPPAPTADNGCSASNGSMLTDVLFAFYVEALVSVSVSDNVNADPILITRSRY